MIYKKIGNFHLLLNPAERNKVSMELLYTAGGSIKEVEEDRGRRHLLEHCICSRTTDMDFAEFKRFTFENGINYNAYTSVSHLAVEASGHHSDFKLIFDTFLNIFTVPSYGQEDLDREKEIVLREITERKGDPNYKLYYDTLNQVLTPDSVALNQVLGTSEAVAATTIDDLKRIHHELIRQSEFIIVISGGGMDLEHVYSQIESITADEFVSGDRELVLEAKDVFKTPEAEYVLHKFGHEEAELNIHVDMPITLENRAKRDIFANLYLTWSDGSLYDLLRDDLGLVYGYHYRFDLHGQHLQIEMNCRLDDVQLIESKTKEYFSNFDTKFSQRKFDALKKKLIKNQDVATDNPNNEVSFAAHTLFVYGQYMDHGEFTRELEAVSAEEVQELFESVSKSLDSAKVVVVSREERVKDVFKQVE